MSGRQFAYLCTFMLAAVIGGSVTVAMLSAPRGEEPLRLLLVTSGSEAERRALAEGALAAADEFKVELAVRSVNQARPDSFVESIASVVADGVQGAIVSQAINDETVRELKRVSGVTNLVTCGGEAAVTDSLMHVGANPYSAGRICGNFVKELLPNGGRIVVLVDADDDVAATRLTALKDALQWSPGGQVADWDVITMSIAGASEQGVRDLELELRGDRVGCVVDLRCGTAPAMTARLAAVAGSERVQFITFDNSEEALAAVETGDVCAVISENAFDQGYQAVQHLASICRGNAWRRPKPGCGQVNVPVSIVRRGNVAEYRAHLLAAVTPPAA
jgi:ribose transport system substrate-binding protein